VPLKKKLPAWVAVLITGFALLATTSAFSASRPKVLHSFRGKDGADPWGGLIFDAAGNLYGTTSSGGTACGSYGCGTAFELIPSSDGKWVRQLLHTFRDNGKDGIGPWASLVFDAAGNLYGTTRYGGSHCRGTGGCGTVFELMPGPSGKWSEKVLYSFCARSQCKDGSSPYASLVFDASGNIYGTASSGGAHDGGVVFQLSGEHGKWAEKVLYSFCSRPQCADGSFPYASLTFDKAANLYGAATTGGTYGFGAVFELTQNLHGTWTENVLYSFCSTTDCADGSNPYANVIFDANGNLFGTTANGGSAVGGTAFQLVPSANGIWSEEVLYDFSNSGGSFPASGLVFDKAGNLYGTTSVGGLVNAGTVFRLSPGRNGRWVHTELDSLGGNYGSISYAGVVLDAAGNLYGTAAEGGVRDLGSVFEIKP